MIPQWLANEVHEYHVNLVNPPKTILDIGANIGAFALQARQWWPEAMIHAYEPVYENARQFIENCGTTNVEVFMAAVRSTGETQYMFSGNNHSTGSFHNLGRQTEEKIMVKCVAADTLPKAEFVKIDTEGCELEIVLGLNLAETKAVVVEYHRTEDVVAIDDVLLAQGFELVRRIEYTPTNGLLKYARPGAVVKPAKPHLCIAIPTYGGTPIDFTQCLMKLQAQPPCDYSMMFVPGDSLVSRARNTLTAQFLTTTDCTHLLFIDSDLIFSGEQIKRLVEHDVDLVCGFYPKKKEGPVEWVCNAISKDKVPLPCGLQEVRYMGTGFMLVKRCVFEKMIAAHGRELGYISDSSRHLEFDFWSVGTYASPQSSVPSPQSTEFEERIAECVAAGLSEEDARVVAQKRYLSEDWFFCQRWLDLGGKVWGDTRVILKHIGSATYPLQSQLSELAPGLTRVD